MRRSELIGIRNVDVDYEAMQVKVTGKRNKQRLIPFAEGLKNLMLAYTEVRDREVEAAGEWFFVRKNGNQLSTGIVYNIVKKQLSEIPMLAETKSTRVTTFICNEYVKQRSRTERCERFIRS